MVLPAGAGNVPLASVPASSAKTALTRALEVIAREKVVMRLTVLVIAVVI